jgi:hypothetical protein
MTFAPERVVIETTSGIVVHERSNPRAAFAGHTLNTPWDLLHRAYFNGYARWTYLATPFLMAMPGFEVAESAFPPLLPCRSAYVWRIRPRGQCNGILRDGFLI